MENKKVTNCGIFFEAVLYDCTAVIESETNEKCNQEFEEERYFGGKLRKVTIILFFYLFDLK